MKFDSYYGGEQLENKLMTFADSTPVCCNRCHWQGLSYQLRPIYLPNPKEQGDVIPTPACPGCLSDQWLEYKYKED